MTHWEKEMGDSLGKGGSEVQTIYKHLQVCTAFGILWRQSHQSIPVSTGLSSIDVFVSQVR